MNDDRFRPFEWVTDSSSVIPIVRSVLSKLRFIQKEDGDDVPRGARILHVGSGSSALGEHVVETLGDSIELVVNVDKDEETLQRMEQRWKSLSSDGDYCNVRDKLEFEWADFASPADELIPKYPNGYFDICLDKSTMDCTLCSECATGGLLAEVYRLLNPHGGTYIVLSFHHLDLLKPLLQDLPGTDWEVSHTMIQRQVEDLIGASSGGNKTTTSADQKQSISDHLPQFTPIQDAKDTSEGPWASGSFEPGEQYRRTVNVIVCRRRGPPKHDNATTCLLDRNALNKHVQATSNQWFQLHNPMLTPQRRETIQKRFEEHQTGGSETSLCGLHTAYNMLFTDEERDHLTYDLFLEDWEAWISEKNDPGFPKDEMSVETALEFLQAMQ
jgi:ubiquinone/menaquinone biosynthesis C-methylase UbiE